MLEDRYCIYEVDEKFDKHSSFYRTNIHSALAIMTTNDWVEVIDFLRKYEEKNYRVIDYRNNRINSIPAYYECKTYSTKEFLTEYSPIF